MLWLGKESMIETFITCYVHEFAIINDSTYMFDEYTVRQIIYFYNYPHLYSKLRIHSFR